MAFAEVDEKLLVQAYQAGDDRAFDTIVRTQYNALYAHAMRRLNDHESAEDAVQDTLLRAYRALGSLDGDLALRAWLHRILTNVCHDEGNRRRRQQGLVEKVSALPDEVAGDPADEAILFDTVRVMAQALDSLPESYREALVLRYVDGLSFREVAEATGVTEENARARVHRGRALLHKVLTRVSVMLAFLIPGLRRTHGAGTTAADQAAASAGVSDHTVSLATQLTSHAMSAAPTVSRFAEAASSLPGGKSTIAAAAVAAVTAAAVPVAYTVNEVRKPDRPPAAVASPLPEHETPKETKAETKDVTSTTATTVASTTTIAPPSSLTDPFKGDSSGVVLAPVTPQPADSGSTTTTPADATVEKVEGTLKADPLTVTGSSPQYDVDGSITLQVGKRTRAGDIVGRIHIYSDSSADSDGLTVTIGDKTLVLRFRGTVYAVSGADDEATYHISGTYVLSDAESVDLAERGDLAAEFHISGSGPSSLLLELSGQESS